MQLRTVALGVTALAAVPHGYRTVPVAVPAIAYASFAPLNTDLFVADADGSGAEPFLPHAGARLQRVVLAPTGDGSCSRRTRNGSADLYRAHADGTGLEQLTDDLGVRRSRRAVAGRTVARVRVDPRRQADIWILDLATRGLRNLTNAPRAATSGPRGRPTASGSRSRPTANSKKPRRLFTVVHSTEIYVVRRDGYGSQSA